MSELAGWLDGQMGARARVLTALLPALLAVAYFVGGGVVYIVRCLVRGAAREWEKDARGGTALVGRHVRYYFFWVIDPFWRLLLASGVSANTVTAAAALCGVGAAGAVACGRFALGGWLFLLSGILDVMDGRVARARQQVSPAGEAIDSVLDRYTDALMLIGLGVYYRSSWVVVFVLLALFGTMAVPYVRAKSEALGRPVRDGLMQRPERILYLGASVALSPIYEALVNPADPRPPHWLAAVGIVFLAITSNATAIGRFITLVRSLSAPTAAETSGVAKARRSRGIAGAEPRRVG